jgi:thymidylate synthase (FAD)
MKIQTYDDMKLQVLDKTPVSLQIMKFACDVTQKKADDISDKGMSPKLAKYLIDAEHDSIFEHSSITFLASGISRSLLAQVTRQRTFSFTSASQHYQNYKDYPMALRPGWDDFLETGETSMTKAIYKHSLGVALKDYIRLIDLGEPPEEARQVLPNACTVNLIITANPRAIAKFLRQRLCQRNTAEMLTFAAKLRQICVKWIPEIFMYIGAPCDMIGKCNQGKMSCKK